MVPFKELGSFVNPNGEVIEAADKLATDGAELSIEPATDDIFRCSFLVSPVLSIVSRRSCMIYYLWNKFFHQPLAVSSRPLVLCIDNFTCI